MIHGITCEVENKWGNIFYDILKGVGIKEFTWYVGSSECYSNAEKDYRFHESYYTGQALYDAIHDSDVPYYVIFADYKAFPAEGKASKVTTFKDYMESELKIVTFQDYLESECQMALFIVDVMYIEFYCKSEEVLQQVYKNVSENPMFFDIQYITDEKNLRTNMYI